MMSKKNDLVMKRFSFVPSISPPSICIYTFSNISTLKPQPFLVVLAQPMINVLLYYTTLKQNYLEWMDGYKMIQTCRVSSACAYAPLPLCEHALHCARHRAHGRVHAGGCSFHFIF